MNSKTAGKCASITTTVSVRVSLVVVGDRQTIIASIPNAPHTLADITSNTWDHPYDREQAAYPVESLRRYKYWAPVNRVDNVYGDRNLFCACPAIDSYREEG